MERLSHKARFTKYRDDSVIQKATQYAKWTLPQLMAEQTQGHRSSPAAIERDYQEAGPLLVNNLSAKLAGLLFPSSRPFYKIDASPDLLKAAMEAGRTEAELQQAFALLEQKSCLRLFVNASYNQIVMALKHLIITGNVLLYRDSKRSRSVAYGLQHYSVLRDGQGNMLDCILREHTDISSLEPDVQAAVRRANPTRYNGDCPPPVELYTRIHRKRGESGKLYCEVTQEADSVPVGTPGIYPERLCPWQAITWSLLVGENYGRGLVEDFAGGFAKLSDGSHAATLYSIEMMKVVNLVAPGLGADVDELANAESGEYVSGATGSVTAYENGDGAKLQAMRAELAEVFSNLARAFMYKANTRDAERVTAFELKQDALEAETTLGGVYSSLAEAMQIPLAHILLTEADASVLEGLVTDTLELNIIAGIPALGRASDVQNLLLACQDAIAIIPGLVQIDRRIDPAKVFDMIMAGSSVDTSAFLKSKDQLAAENDAEMQKQAGQNQMMDAAAAAETTDTLQQVQ